MNGELSGNALFKAYLLGAGEKGIIFYSSFIISTPSLLSYGQFDAES